MPRGACNGPVLIDVAGILSDALGTSVVVCQSLTVSCAPSQGMGLVDPRANTLGNNMTALSVSQATQALTITRAIKSRWHSASRKEDGSYEMAPAPSERRVRSLIPWRRTTEAMVEAELRQRVAVAEEQFAELKTALGDIRAQRDAWQVMAQARIRPASSGKGPWSWVRSTVRR